MRGGYVGVDVFFVISGFLITGLLAAEFEERGRLDLVRFYARRARRLLPASAATLLGTVFLTFLFLPVNRWGAIAGDIVSSALYVVNWRLAGRAVDYLASESAASPVQHFWSLAVEEQYYLVWPLVIVLGVLAAHRAHTRARPLVTALVLVLVGVSLTWSVLLTASDPGRAYFVTPTRVWQLGLGAGLALLAPRIPKLGSKLGVGLAVVGVSMILLAVTTYSSATAFPGWRAALPTLGAVAVIAAGTVDSGHKLEPVLGHGVSQWIGARSYSLYLWHWPIVVVVAAMVDEMTVWWGLLAVAISFVPAMASYRWVENPLRRSRRYGEPRRAFPLALACTGLGVVAGLALFATLDVAREEPESDVVELTSDPLVADSVPASVPDDLVPSLADVADDLPPVHEQGCHVPHSSVEAVACEFGDSSGPVVVLVGDSHAGQWVPGFVDLAESEGWHLYTMSKSACPFLDAAFYNRLTDGPYDECSQWNRAVMQRITAELDPALVVVTSSMTNEPLDESGDLTEGAEADRLLEEGLISTLNGLRRAGVEVVVLRDTPLPSQNVPDCLGRQDDVMACSTPRSETFLSEVQQRAAGQVEGVGFVDLTDWICTPDLCPAVVGSILVWRDASHLSTVYARSLAPVLDEHLPEL